MGNEKFQGLKGHIQRPHLRSRTVCILILCVGRPQNIFEKKILLLFSSFTHSKIHRKGYELKIANIFLKKYKMGEIMYLVYDDLTILI